MVSNGHYHIFLHKYDHLRKIQDNYKQLNHFKTTVKVEWYMFQIT